MKKALIFLLSTLLFACQQNDKEALEPMLSEDEMVAIMVDLAVSDAMVEHELLPTNQLIYQKKLSFYEDVFEKHAFTAEEFEESYLIYAEDLKQLDALYDRVLEQLSEKEIELKSDI